MVDLEICLDCGGYNPIADYSPWCGVCSMMHERQQYNKAANS